MRRVVVTGMGIWSCIGQDLQTVTESLKQGRPGIIFDPARIEYGLQSGLVGNVPRPDLKPYLPRKARQMMSEDAEYAYMAARQALEQAGITEQYAQNNEIGIIWGSEGSSHQQEYSRIMEQEHCSALIGYNAIFRSVTSSAAVNLSFLLHLRGVNMTIDAACASSLHAIGVASMYVKQGLQDIILVGGSNELAKENIGNIVVDSQFVDTKYNTIPQLASRPYDKDAVGEILSGGAAALVVEEYEHAKERGATILAEIIGYGFATGQNGEIYLPDWYAEQQAVLRAIQSAGIQPRDIDYVRSHATSNRISDPIEAYSLQKLFGELHTPISATESITGHEGAMVGASGTVYAILMLLNGFIAPNINLKNPVKEAQNLNIIRETTFMNLNIVLNSAIGLGGMNSAIVLKKI
jgi:3-oxoacyl-[acyl-carrier-protein] synthase-1